MQLSLSGEGVRDPNGSRVAIQVAVEVLVAVGLASAGVGALEGTAPLRGLGVLYLLAVLAIAVRRGEVAGLATAVGSVLAFNYLFIPPVHRLAIARSDDVVELVVLLVAAVVVGRLASRARAQAAESDRRARIAHAREREARLLAESASAILAGPSVEAQLHALGRRIALATGAPWARVALEAVPEQDAGHTAVRLGTRERPAWLYVAAELDTAAGWTGEDLGRIADPLGRLIDVALERDRVTQAATETETARRAETARTAVLHSISHDLRSPLTAMTTAAAALRLEGVSAAERSELIGVIETEGARLEKLVSDLLDLSRIEAGAVAPQPDWCDIRDAVISAAAHAGGGHSIEIAMPDELPLVRADAVQLERVFSNLIDNAIKFSPPGSPVRITGGTGSGRVVVRVIDAGRGIPSPQRARVFEPFFRGRSGGESERGSGLGLAICRGFVEANGGQIVLQSGTGRGTAFAVSLPVIEQPAGADAGLTRA